MNGDTPSPALRDTAEGRFISEPLFESARVTALIAALGRARVATMLDMLRAEADPLRAAAQGETPFPPRFDDHEHVHALKGAAASLGAATLAAALAALEHALRAGDEAAAQAAQAPLLAAASATHAAILAGAW